jgi:hypothetical protein
MADFEPRHVPANTEVGYTAANGEQRTLRSKALDGDDEYYVIEPQDAADVEILDSLEYPVARKAIAAAEDETTDKKKSGAKSGGKD